MNKFLEEIESFVSITVEGLEGYNDMIADGFDIAVLAMIIEGIAKTKKVKLLDLYDTMRNAAESVVAEYGEP